MRNYVKLLAMHWTSGVGSNLWAFGANDENLLANVVWMEEFVAQYPYARTTPQVLYVLLDETNIADILSVNLDVAYAIWIRTRLNGSDGPAFPINDFPNRTLYEQTQVKAEGSPRRTWSHGE